MKFVAVVFAAFAVLGVQESSKSTKHEQDEKVNVAQEDEHITDPKECHQVCVPEGYDGELGEEFPEDAVGVMCKGHKDPYGCSARAYNPDHDVVCEETNTCTEWCSKPCCICVRECKKIHHQE